MFRVTFVLLVTIGVLLGMAIAQDEQCGQNQEWTACGTRCPPTCDNPSRSQPCTYDCVIGCQCKDGYLMDRWGHCLAPHECLR